MADSTPTSAATVAATSTSSAAPNSKVAIESTDLSLWYGDFQALHNIDLQVKKGMVTSLIGPSGCGKSTFLRTVNRINERLGYVRTTGQVKVLGQDILAPNVELVQVRKKIGMVFQRPNPLPLTVRENVLFSWKLANGKPTKAQADEITESALRQVLLWDRIKDRLNAKATSLSLEEQQKLCIARLLPVQPEVLLMDEPCSALDPAATAAVEELIWKLREEYTILIVTHNMAQARRASDECVFMLMGKIIEHGQTGEMFLAPQNQETADYIEGRYG